MAIVLGLDPGFASLGFAKVEITPDTESVLRLGVVRTEKSTAKRKVLAADDNLRRAMDIADSLLDMTEGTSSGRVVAICAESMSFPRNSSTAAKIAMVWGILATISVSRDVPVLQASPQEVKKKVCGNASASKTEVEEALKVRFASEAPFLTHCLSNVPASQHEHAWDALACVVACLDSEVLRMARRLPS